MLQCVWERDEDSFNWIWCVVHHKLFNYCQVIQVSVGIFCSWRIFSFCHFLWCNIIQYVNSVLFFYLIILQVCQERNTWQQQQLMLTRRNRAYIHQPLEVQYSHKRSKYGQLQQHPRPLLLLPPSLVDTLYILDTLIMTPIMTHRPHPQMDNLRGYPHHLHLRHLRKILWCHRPLFSTAFTYLKNEPGVSGTAVAVVVSSLRSTRKFALMFDDWL